MADHAEQLDRRSSLPSGRIVGGYEILEHLGRGGMGDVYRARNARIGRQVALKILRDKLPNRKEAAQRFLEEARAVNDIGHANIIDIYDFVELDDGEPQTVFLVMELLSGHDLAAYVQQRGQLPPHEAVAIACKVAEALTAVHDHNILHRDLKASNIFITPQPEGAPLVKVLDFGAVKPMDVDRQLDLTQPGMAVGTPWYMAPEQVMDKELDCRTDVYSLGVVIYKMLTTQVPFEHAPFSKLMVLIARTRPASPSNVRPPPPPIPAALEAVVMRCLEKRPEDRFANMAELKQALEQSLESVDPDAPAVGNPPAAPSLANPDGATRALHGMMVKSPRRWIFVGVLALGLLSIVFGIVLLLTATRAPTEAATADAGVAEPDSQAFDSEVVSRSDSAASAQKTPAKKRRPRPRRRPKRGGKASGKRPAHLKIVDPFKR